MTRTRGPVSGWRRSVGHSVAIALLVTVAVTLVAAIGSARPVLERVDDAATPRIGADPRVVVVALDADFFAYAAASNFGVVSIANAFGYNLGVPTTSYIVRDEVFDAINPGMAAPAFDDVAARVFPNVSGAVLVRTGVGAIAEPGSTFPRIIGDPPTDQLRRSVQAVAFDSAAPTGDSEVARTAALLGDAAEPGGKVVPSSALVALLRSQGGRSKVVLMGDELLVGRRHVPIDRRGRIRVSYSDALLPGGRSVVPARSVIEGRVDNSVFEGATVVVGVTDPTRARLVPAPISGDRELPAAFVDANAVNTLLTDSVTRPVQPALQVGLTFAVALAVALGSLAVSLVMSVVLAGVAVAALWNGAALIGNHGYSIQVGVLLLAVLAAFLATVAWRAGREFLRRRRLVRLFSQYVPATVARQLVEPEQLRVLSEGTRLDVTVLFCDLRGFTPMCARLDPAEVRVVLDSFYAAVSKVLLTYGGTIMQFTGDEVFGVFGAPLAQTDHATRAIRAAKALLALADDPALDLPSFGIGLNSGDVVAANVGSELRRQYNVIGDAVNVGARLCSRAAGGQAIVAATTVARAGELDLPLERMPALELKGVEGPVAAFVMEAPRGDRTAVPAGTSEGIAVPTTPGEQAHDPGRGGY